MSYLERETVTYHTQLAFRINKARRARQGWKIAEQEQIVPKSKVLGLFLLLFPVLRVTYQRAVGSGIAFSLPKPLVIPPNFMPPHLQKPKE